MSDEREEIRPEAARDPVGTEVTVGSEAEEEDSTRVEVPEILPVLPLKNTVLFPFLLSPLLVSSPRSKTLIDAVLLTPQRLLVCAAVRRPIEGSPGADDVYRVGTVMRIAKMLKFPDESGGMSPMKALFDAGVYTFFAANDPSVLQCKPSLVITDDDADWLIDVVRTTFG